MANRPNMPNNPTKLSKRSRAGGIFSGAIMGAIAQPFAEAALYFTSVLNAYRIKDSDSRYRVGNSTLYNIARFPGFVIKMIFSPILGIIRGIKNGFKNGFKASLNPLNIYQMAKEAKLKEQGAFSDDKSFSEELMKTLYDNDKVNDIPIMHIIGGTLGIMFVLGTVFTALAGAGVYSAFGFVLGSTLAGGALALATGGIFLVLTALVVGGVLFMMNKMVASGIKAEKDEISRKHGIEPVPEQPGFLSRLKSTVTNFFKRDKKPEPEEKASEPGDNALNQLSQNRQSPDKVGENERLLGHHGSPTHGKPKVKRDLSYSDNDEGTELDDMTKHDPDDGSDNESDSKLGRR